MNGLNDVIESVLEEVSASRTLPVRRVGELLRRLRVMRNEAVNGDKHLIFTLEFCLLMCATQHVSDMGRQTAPDMMNAKQAAKFCGISPKTLYTLLASGGFPRPAYLGQRSPRYRREELVEWLAKCPRRAKRAKSQYENATES